MALLKKYWINQPSSQQNFHAYHGRVGVLHEGAFYFADGKDDTLSIYLGNNPLNYLSKMS